MPYETEEERKKKTENPPRSVVGRDYARGPYPGPAQAVEAIKGAAETIAPIFSGRGSYARLPQAPMTAPIPSPGAVRRQSDEVAAMRAKETHDQARAPGAAVPGQGPNQVDAKGTGTVEPNPEEFGKYGWLRMEATGKLDPATRPGGFAYGGGMTPKEPPLPKEATLTHGPRAITGGHVWTMRTPGAQEAAYERARYAQEVRMRQAEEDETRARMKAGAAEAEATTARAEALREQPFAPEEATIAAEVGGERAKAQPAMTRAQQAAILAQDLIEGYNQIDEAMAKGMIDQARARELRDQLRERYSLQLAGVIGRFPPREDPLAQLAAQGATEREES